MSQQRLPFLLKSAGGGVEKWDMVRRAWCRRNNRVHDDGVTMIEVVVSMVIFGVLASVSATLLASGLDVTKRNTQRVTASELATRQIEAARSLDAKDIPDGGVTSTASVGGTSYTILQTANFVASGSTTSVCSGSGDKLAYKLVTVTVTWPQMKSTRPVRLDTLRALGIGDDGLSTTKGVAAVGLVDSNGAAVAGISVSMKNSAGTSIGTRTTGSDGCAVFSELAAGTYTASVNQTGYVTTTGLQAASSTVGVTANTVTRVSIPYDLAGALAVTFVPPTGYTAPSTLAASLDNTLFTPKTTRPFPDCSLVSTSPAGCVSGTPRTAAALYPGRYKAWAGTCSDAAPAASSSQTTVVAGSTASTTAPLGGVQVLVTNSAGVVQVGASVYGVHLTESSSSSSSASPCTSGESYLLGTSTATGLLVALPPGKWTFALNAAASPGPSSGSWPSVTLVAGTANSTAVTVRS